MPRIILDLLFLYNSQRNLVYYIISYIILFYNPDVFLKIGSLLLSKQLQPLTFC